MAKKPPPKTSRKSWIAAFAIAILFWAGVWWLLSLRDQSVSAGRQHRARAFQAQQFLREIKTVLATYRKERGVVPQSPNENEGARILFENLVAGPKRYLGPRPDRIRHDPETGSSILIDPWGDPLKYRTGVLPPRQVTPNSDYDLWSTGGVPGSSRERWITP